MAAVHSEKQIRARTQPCLRTPLMGNGPESEFWWRTLPNIPSWRARTKMTKSDGHPNFARTAHIVGRGTLSKAFFRYGKMNVAGCCCSKVLLLELSGTKDHVYCPAGRSEAALGFC